MSEPSAPSPSPPPRGRNGCLQALAIVVGIVLLLPGLCAIILIGAGPRMAREDVLFLLLMLGIGAGGIALIWWAVRRPRQ
ncbi:MAG TPA: hypothetical protein VLX44_03635 [Xanthobacteraceae bacterium]|nr:hypothetical protein [Xanthobacteraceae bacterium]